MKIQKNFISTIFVSNILQQTVELWETADFSNLQHFT